MAALATSFLASDLVNLVMVVVMVVVMVLILLLMSMLLVPPHQVRSTDSIDSGFHSLSIGSERQGLLQVHRLVLLLVVVGFVVLVLVLLVFVVVL